MTTGMAIARRRPSPAPTPLQDNHGGRTPLPPTPSSGITGATSFLSIVVLLGLLVITGHASAAQLTALAALVKALVTGGCRLRRQD
ncbi:MAG TPA: hypothetical protein VGZ32_20635 [Actinocrinis sp.]|nr:hypothetical protein [Actinocrinis sp.]